MATAATRSATFLGYRRASGPPGVRNHVLVLSLSGLDNAAARAVHRLLPRTVLVGTTYGRGHIGADARFQTAMTSALAAHPNVAGVVVVGPDDRRVGETCEAARAAGRLVAGVSLEAAREDRFSLIDKAARAATRMLREASRQRRVELAASELAVAIECGHSDATSGMVANPLAGDAACWLVRQGGRAVFSETLEWTGTGDILAQRAATDEVARAIRAALAARQATAAAAGHDVQQNNPGPQNRAGGLTTLEEKSLGAIAKGGEQPVTGLVAEGARLPQAPGLYLMDTPCFSPESITSMIAAGCQLVLFTTGAGNPYGSALAPTVKITANPATAGALGEQIDFDASAVLAGIRPREDLAPGLVALMLEIASGTLTLAECAGEATESISRLGPSI